LAKQIYSLSDLVSGEGSRRSDFDLAHANPDQGADDAGDGSESHEPAEHEKYAIHLDVPRFVIKTIQRVGAWRNIEGN
jgi:hypothetical protein